MDVPKFEKFNCNDELTSAGSRWKKYTQRFKNMLFAFKVDSDEQ